MEPAKNDDIWAKFEEFDNAFKRLFEKAIEKFGAADEQDCQPGVGGVVEECDGAAVVLENVRVESNSDMGNILVAATNFSCSDLILAEIPALEMPSSAFQRVSHLQEALAKAAVDFDFSNYEAHLTAAPVEVKERMQGESNLLQAYMVFRINGMQWGRHQLALFEVASKASHSCCPNAIFGQRAMDGKGVCLEVRAVRNICEEEQVTLDYLDNADDLICPTFIRQRILYSHRFFVCACSRCNAADSGDPCRKLPCPCGGMRCIRSKKNDMESSRYSPGVDIVAAECGACGRLDVDQSLLDLERDASKELEELLEAAGDITVMNLMLLVDMAAIDDKGFDMLGRIDTLYSRTRSLGKGHWIFCRASLLKWRAMLIQAQKQNVEVSDDSFLAEAIDFVENQCPELLPNLVGSWVAESARFLMQVGIETATAECLLGARALVVYSQFQRVATIAHFDTTEPWFILFEQQASIDLTAPD